MCAFVKQQVKETFTIPLYPTNENIKRDESTIIETKKCYNTDIEILSENRINISKKRNTILKAKETKNESFKENIKEITNKKDANFNMNKEIYDVNIDNKKGDKSNFEENENRKENIDEYIRIKEKENTALSVLDDLSFLKYDDIVKNEESIKILDFELSKELNDTIIIDKEVKSDIKNPFLSILNDHSVNENLPNNDMAKSESMSVFEDSILNFTEEYHNNNEKENQKSDNKVNEYALYATCEIDDLLDFNRDDASELSVGKYSFKNYEFKKRKLIESEEKSKELEIINDIDMNFDNFDFKKCKEKQKKKIKDESILDYLPKK